MILFFILREKDLSTIHLMELVFIIYVISMVINLGIWLVGFGRLAHYKSPKNIVNNEGLSIVVCSRNGLLQLQQNLPAILSQSHPNFEVIVVDDDSNDASLSWLYEMQRTHQHLRVIAIKNTLPGKKMALKAGIDAAQNDWILVTDVDCRPTSLDWALQMMNSKTAQSEIVLGFGPYVHRKGWLNKLIRYETLITAIQYLAAAIHGIPYMGVGRNMLYHKSILKDFDRVVQYQMASGDDDLLVNALGNKRNCSICIEPSAFMISEPKENIRAWLHQKTRHISSGYHYRVIHQCMLFLYGVTQIGVLLFFVLILSKYLLWALFIYLIRLLGIMWVQRGIFTQLKATDLWQWVPILDIGMSIYFLLIHPLGICMKWGQKGHFITGVK